MLQKLPNPSILSNLVSHYSFRFRAEDFTGDMEQLGVKLPVALARSTRKRQLEYLVGRYVAALACRDAGVTEKIDIPIADDKSPVWPVGFVGAITHTEGFVSAAVANRKVMRGLGIDSEIIVTPKTLIAIREIVASEGEYAMGDTAGLRATELLTLLFSAKESIYKCLSPIVGRFFDFLDVEITRIDHESGQFDFRLKRDLSNEFVTRSGGSGRFVFDREYVHTAIEVLSIPLGNS